MSHTLMIICIAFAAAAVAGLLVFGIVKLVQKNRREKVLATSNRVAALQELNATISEGFAPLKREYYSCSLNSRTRYDNFDPKQYFFMAAAKEGYKLQVLLDAADHNEMIWQRYLEAQKDFPASQYSDVKLQKIEAQIMDELQLKTPDTDPIVRVEWFYTSQQGSKFYSNSIYFGKSVIEEACRIAATKQTRQAQISHERALMTDKLRYEVMKRDGFKCVICGSSVKDGVQLQIDHIVPVSKGGKSTMDNLRTLCDRCNGGKGDTLEE